MAEKEARELAAALGKMGRMVQEFHKGPKASLIVKRLGDPKPYFKAFMPLFSKVAYVKANNYTKAIAKEIVKRAKEILDKQRYNWAALNDAYLEWKIENDLDERILIATKFYRNHITWWTSRGNVHVGVRNNVVHPVAKFPLWKLARIHEYGTKRIPARPLWRPILAEMLAKHKRFKGYYYKGVEKALRPQLAISKWKTLGAKGV